MPLSDTLKAALWMMGSVVSFSAMAVAGREMSLDLDTFEIMMYRSMIGVVIVLSCACYFGTFPQINRAQLGLHFSRNICHFIGQNLWFFAVALIPFTQLFAFEFSIPIWVTLAAPFLLYERLTLIRILSVLIGFLGILIVTRPWMAPLSPGIIAAALCAICFAGSAIFTKMLTRTQTITCILFWLTVMQLAFGILCAGYDADIALPTPANVPWMIVVGIAGLFGHFCLTTALRLAPATVVMPVDFTRLPLIAIIGAVFYNEALEIWVVIGAIIIFASNYINIWDENRKKRPVT